LTREDSEEGPRNIIIPDSEGKHEVTGPKAQVPHISKPLEAKKVNIRSEPQAKFTNIGDY